MRPPVSGCYLQVCSGLLFALESRSALPWATGLQIRRKTQTSATGVCYSSRYRPSSKTSLNFSWLSGWATPRARQRLLDMTCGLVRMTKSMKAANAAASSLARRATCGNPNRQAGDHSYRRRLFLCAFHPRASKRSGFRPRLGFSFLRSPVTIGRADDALMFENF